MSQRDKPRLALNNITAGVREREDANRTREAGHLDEIQGVVANTLNLYRNGAVGFIDWLGLLPYHFDGTFVRDTHDVFFVKIDAAIRAKKPLLLLARSKILDHSATPAAATMINGIVNRRAVTDCKLISVAKVDDESASAPEYVH